MQIQKINLDFSQNYYRDIVVKQSDKDSRAVIITVTDNGVKYPLDSSIHMCNVKMLTPDGRAIYNETTILSDGTIRIDFTEQMVLASGTGDLEIQIATSTETISTMHLNVVIIGSVYPDDEIIASDEFNALTAALLKVQSGSSSGFNDIYAETSMNLGRKADTTVGKGSVTGGVDNEASKTGATAFGGDNTVSSWYGFASGWSNTITKDYGVALGLHNEVNGISAFASGEYNKATAEATHVEGYYCEASEKNAHAEGCMTKSSGEDAHAEGYSTNATKYCAHAEGYKTTASGNQSHAENYVTEASGDNSHAEGFYTKASGRNAHAEGNYTEATSSDSHTEGFYCKATGSISHAEGNYAEAKGYVSHVEGYYTIASGQYQHVQGQYNIEDTENKYAHIVGGGTSDSARKNIHTLDWDGNAVFAGSVTDGNGATIGGIEGATENTVTVPIESPVIINSITGVPEQDTTTGLQFYHFVDCEATQNGITIKFEDGIGTLTGTCTGNDEFGFVYDLYFDPIDVSTLTDGIRYYANDCGGRGYCAFKICDANGNIVDISSGYEHCQPAFTYDSATMSGYTITPHIYSGSYKEGMIVKPIISAGVTVSKSQWEKYSGGIPAPNPNYKQPLSYPTFDVISVTNGTNSYSAILPEEISLYGVNDIADVINKTQYIKRLELITLTSSDEFTLDDTTGCFIYTPTVTAKAGSANIVSNSYKYFENTYETNYSIYITDEGNIAFRHDDFTTVDDYKTWLTSNNVIIIYERAIEEVTTLDSNFVTELANLKLFIGENTVSTDSASIQPIIDFDYATSKMGKYVMELLARVAALEGNATSLSSILTTETF